MNSAVPKLQVKTIDHVTLVVQDLERSRKFYVDLLGMEMLDRPNFSFAGSWFRAGKTEIHLILEHEESGKAGRLDPQHRASSRSQHFAFEVADSRQAAEWLAQQGVAILSGPKARPDGAVQTFVQDPDGHVVELCSPPKPA